jgi:hypothetical protein
MNAHRGTSVVKCRSEIAHVLGIPRRIQRKAQQEWPVEGRKSRGESAAASKEGILSVLYSLRKVGCH